MFWFTLLCAAASAWTLGDAHHVESHALTDPMFDWQLRSGTLYEVLDDVGNRSGFVFVGSSDVTLHPGEGRPSQVLANRLVATLDYDKETARAIGEADALGLGVDGAVVLGADAWEAVAGGAIRIDRFRKDRVVTATEPDGLQHVIVQSRRRLRRDRQLAEQWLRERTVWMDEHGVEPGGVLDADRWEIAAGTGAPGRWVASLRTDIDWGLYAGDVVQPRTPHRWLEVLRDPSGVFDPDSPSSAWASGPDGGPRLRVARGGWDRARRNIDVDGMGVSAYFSPLETGIYLTAGVATDMRIRAVGGDTTHVVVDLPHVHKSDWNGLHASGVAFEIAAVESAGGEALLYHPLSIGNQADDAGWTRTIAIRLPEVLRDGETTIVRVKTIDTHLYAHLHDYGWMGMPGGGPYSFGNTTGLVRVLPEVRGRSLGAFPVTLRAGVGPGVGTRTHIVGSHEAGVRSDTQTGRWVELSGDSAAMALAVGKWFDETVPSTNDGPSIGLHPLHGTSDFDRVAAAVTPIVEMYEGALPAFPHDHLELIEDHRDPYAPPSHSIANAVIGPSESQAMSSRITLFGGARLAQALHQQWWVDQPVAAEDRALPSVSALLYTLDAMQATDAADEVEQVWNGIYGYVPRHSGWSGSRAHGTPILSLALALGPILDDDAGGPQARFAAIDQILSGQHPPSWDGFAAALQEATGRDWDGFVLTWVHSGTAPKVDVTWRREGDEILGRVDSDLPFGSFRLPVRVGSGPDALWAHLPVTDGSVDFRIPTSGRPGPLVADPHGVLPLRGLQVRREG